MVRALIGAVLVCLLFPSTALAVGVSPGEVYISGLSPGESGSVLITVHNEGDEGTTFKVSIRQPDNTKEGYESLWNPEYLTSNEEVYVLAGSSEQVELTITAPSGEATELKKYETWVDVRENAPEGMIVSAVAVRVLITTTAPMIGFEVAKPSKPIDWQRVGLYGLGGLCILLALGWLVTSTRRKHAEQKSQ